MSKFDPKIVAGSPRRNKFDLSYYSRLTSRMGDLVPVLCKKIVPSDEFRVSINAITRFAPLANPIYDRLRIDYDAFFVQNRIIDPQFKEFLTGGIGLYGETSTEGMKNISLVGTKMVSNISDLNLIVGPSSLLSNLGLQFDLNYLDSLNFPVTFDIKINAEPVLGYLKIYSDWYRNERFDKDYFSSIISYLSSSRSIDFNQLEFNPLLFQKRNYFKDPFTTALSEPLIGGPIPIMSGLAPVVSDGTFASQQISNDESGSLGFAVKQAYTTTTESGLFADLSSVVSNTVQQLNQMYALYRFFMKDTYNGNRYVEFVESHFGVRVPDSTLERPIFLGRYTQVAAFSEVFQTSGSTIQSGKGKNVLGDYAGKGVAAGSGFLFQQKFLEHGYLYIIMSIVPESTYFQGIDGKFMIGDRFESFYFPEFQNIGDVAIPTSLMYSAGSLVTRVDGDTFNIDVTKPSPVFGFQRRNWELIWYPNEIHGEFGRFESMYNWTFARHFSSTPVIGSTFSRVPEINNPFSYSASDAEPFYTDILFNIQALRPVERYESITTH